MKLKSEVKNATQFTLNLPSTVVGDATNFPHKLLFTYT